MIADLFLNVIYWFVSGIIGWFGNSTGFPPGAFSAVSTMGGYLDTLSPIVPVGTLLITVTLASSIEIGIWFFKTFKWIISHLPFIGGKG